MTDGTQGEEKNGGELGNEAGEFGSNWAVNFLFSVLWQVRCKQASKQASSWLGSSSRGSLWIRGPRFHEQTVPLCSIFWVGGCWADDVLMAP